MKHKSFVPEFVLNIYNSGVQEYCFTGCVMIVDLSGFTQLTQSLMEDTSNGVDTLALIIKNIFSPLISEIHSIGGFVSSFAGDSFNAIFPNDTCNSSDVSTTATSLIEIVKNLSLDQKFNIENQINIKIGIGHGDITLGFAKDNFNSTYFFDGLGIRSAVRSVVKANSNEIIYSQSFIHSVNTSSLKPQAYDQDIYEHYNDLIQSAIQDYDNLGEFRKVVSCFISFSDKCNYKMFFSQIMTLSFRYGGFFNKIDFNDKGGIILVLFGAPKSYNNITARACNFSLAVNKLSNFVSRIGLSYGFAFTGFVGSLLRGEYTALGMSVNLSARLAMKAQFGEILVDKNIFNKNRKSFTLEVMGHKSYKGFKAKVPTYKLIQANHLNEFLSYDNLFIGRDNLLYSVVKLIDITVTKCKNMVINIYGKDGVGKTRLAAEMVARFGREEYSWVYTACDQVLKQNSNPIINFFLHYFSIAEHDEYHISHSKIVKTFEKLAENVSNKALIHELNQGIVFIEALLGIVELDNEHIDSEVAKNRHENTFFALTNIFRLMSLNRPVVFFIDNSDDLDEETKDFLTYFIPLVEDYPIFIILLSRDKQSETVTKIKKINSASYFNISNFNEEESKLLVCNLLSSNLDYSVKVPEETLDLIWSKTQGNVFFIEQIINYVKRENLIDSDHKLITSELDIPEDVNSMILTRVDKLDDTLKLVIKTAAVLGVKFNITTLKHMMGGTDIAKYIAEGESENLWEASSRNNYLFRNSLLRDSIYHLLLKSHVKNIHFKAVYTIEKIYQENLSEHYDELIYNSINGELVDKSIEYLIKAGDLAKKLHHHASALSYFTKLINYIADKPIEKETIIIDSNLKFVDIYLEDGNLEKAGEILADITANDLSSDFFIKKYDYLHTKLIFLQEKHRKLLNHLSPKLNSLTNNEYKNFYLIYYLDSLRFLSMNGEFENMAAELIEQHSNDDNDFFVGRVVNLMGVYYMEKGQYFEALQNFKLNFNLIESEENYRFLASGAHNIGTIYHKLGDKEQAIVYYRRALKIAEDTGNRITKCKVLCDIALVEQRENHTDNAIQKLNRALDIATLIQNDNQKSKIYYNLSQINYGKRNFDEALINCLLAKSIGEKLNNRLTTSYVNSLLGKIYFAVGKVSQAKEILLLNIEHQKEIGDSEGLANSYVILAIEANSCKEFNSADKYYSKSFDILHKLGNKKAEGSCLYNWAVCDYEQLKYQEAIAKLNEVISIFTECDYSVGSRAANSLLNSLKKSNIAD